MAMDRNHQSGYVNVLPEGSVVEDVIAYAFRDLEYCQYCERLTLSDEVRRRSLLRVKEEEMAISDELPS